MSNTDTHPDTHADTVSVRLRLTPPQVAKLERVRDFLGLPSLSSTAARLALWNADALAVALGAIPADPDLARLAVRAAIAGACK